MNFQQAVNIVIELEGGHVNDSRDTGGETKYGISKASYPDLQISALSLAEAQELYRADYWEANHVDRLPDYLRLAYFDCTVNCGAGTAIKCLQTAVGAHVDGILGPDTLGRIGHLDPLDTLSKYLMARAHHYSYLKNFSAFGDGWNRRLFKIAYHSARDA